jgi:hypothetical protein
MIDAELRQPVAGRESSLPGADDRTINLPHWL